MASTWALFHALSFFYKFLSIFRVPTQTVFFEVNFSRIFVEFVAHTLVNFHLNSFGESVGMAKINILVKRKLFSLKDCFESTVKMPH